MSMIIRIDIRGVINKKSDEIYFQDRILFFLQVKFISFATVGLNQSASMDEKAFGCFETALKSIIY